MSIDQAAQKIQDMHKGNRVTITRAMVSMLRELDKVLPYRPHAKECVCRHCQFFEQFQKIRKNPLMSVVFDL